MTESTTQNPPRQFRLRRMSTDTSRNAYRKVCERACELYFMQDADDPDPAIERELTAVMDRMRLMVSVDHANDYDRRRAS